MANNFLARMTPKQKQMSAIALAVVALIGVIAISLGGKSSGPEQRWNPKTDKQINVITNDNQKNMGLDAMAGRIKYLDNQNRKLQESVNRLVKDRQADKADTSKEREWKERFDALSAEVNKMRAQQRDSTIRMGASQRHIDGTAGGTSSKEIDDPFEVREQKKKEILGDEIANSIQSTGKSGGVRPSSSGGLRYQRGSGTLRINVVSDPEEEETEVVTPQQTSQQDSKAFIPAGSILTGTLITGADFPTGNRSRENPTPTLIRLSKTAILPNRFRSDVRECFMLVSGHGDLATERATLRSEMLSCVRTDGSVIQTQLSGYVAGEDGKAGMKGRLVSKTGQMIARTMVAGFLAGMSDAFDYDPVEVLSTNASNNVQYQSRWSQDVVKGGFAKGASKSLEKVADYYMNLADQMTPVVEITAGRQVDLVVIKGTYLDVLSGTRNGELSGTTDKVMKPANAS